MSHGILKTALTTTIRLDLSYREPSSLNATDSHTEQHPIVDGPGLQQLSVQNHDMIRMRWMFVGDVR